MVSRNLDPTTAAVLRRVGNPFFTEAGGPQPVSFREGDLKLLAGCGGYRNYLGT